MGPCPRSARATAAAAAAASERESDKKQRQRALLTRCPPNKDEQFRVGPYLNAGGGCGCHQSFEACGVGRRGPTCRSALVALALCAWARPRATIDDRWFRPDPAGKAPLPCYRGVLRHRHARAPQRKNLTRAAPTRDDDRAAAAAGRRRRGSSEREGARAHDGRAAGGRVARSSART